MQRPARRVYRQKPSCRSRRARNALVEANKGFAFMMAKKLGPARGLEEDDAVQAALLGMTRAAELFDASMPNKFVSYAAFRIRMEINRAASLKRGGAYVPRKFHECGLIRDADEATRNALAEPVPYPAEMADGATRTPEQYAVEQEQRELLRTLIDTLPPRWRTVMILRFLSPNEMTLLQIGKRLGVTRQCVEQIEVKAIRSMRMTYLEWQR